MALDAYEPVRVPFPGRRTRKLARAGLVSALILVTFLSTFSHLLPGLLALNQDGGSLELGDSPYRIPSPLEDGPRVSLPPGTVSYGSRATPFMSGVSDSSVTPRLTSMAEAFVYQTSYGIYSFNRTSPFIFTLSSASGVPLTKGSLFFVRASTSYPLLFPGNSTVTAASDHKFEVKYAVLLGNVTVGVMLLRTDFYATARPKFTAEFSPSPSWNHGGFNIVWSTVTIPQWIRTVAGQNKSSAVNIEALTGNSLPASTLSVEVGQSQDSSTWRDWITIDWSDAPGGVLETRPVIVSRLSGMGLSVIFPEGQGTIDPTQVASSPTYYSTAYSTQRKTFSYGGKYFLFWYEGNNIVYSSSLNGLTWSSAYSTGSGKLSFGFDVSNVNSTVAMTWLKWVSGVAGDGVTQLLFRRGTVVGTSIYWDPIRTVASLPQPYSYLPNVAIGTDGKFWASGIWYPTATSTSYNIWIYRSTDGVSFTLSTNYLTSSSGSRIEALQLIPLPTGRLMALSTHYYSMQIRWRIWNPVTNTWTGVSTQDMGLPADTDKSDLISSVSSPDGSVHTVFSRIYDVYYTTYNAALNQWESPTSLYGWPVRYPSVTVDALGNLYAFWMGLVQGFPLLLAHRAKMNGQAWSSISNPFGYISQSDFAAWLSTPRYVTKQVSVAWTTIGNSPYKIMYASIPVPSGVASASPSEPWNEIGRSPAGEFVSPANGLLTISQADISIPGRNGLSVSISRTYIQPFTFLQGSPFNYETGPYANLGNGWQLNVPWIGVQNTLPDGLQYLHYFNGLVIPIIWTNYATTTSGSHTIKTWSFEDHGAGDVRLTKTQDYDSSTSVTTTSYKLTTKDGTAYNFNESGLLTSIVDRTSQNQIGFSYTTSNNLQQITDTVGRTATFSYASGRLLSVAYGGQTVTYGYSGNNLSTVTDGIGRTITFRYSSQNSWLISGVIYPTGGNSTYAYGSVNIGTDAVNYQVTLQNLFAGSLSKSTNFSYQITDGTITYAEVTQSDGISIQGYTIHEFSPSSKSSTVTLLDSNRNQMQKTRSWYNDDGRVVQEDVYSGNTSSRTSYSSLFYDDWGNIIYTKDALGHESFASYANTDSQYTFYGPGKLTPTVDGKIFYDDFNTPVLNTGGWVQGGSATSRITATGSSLLLQGASSVSGGWQSNWVRTSGTFGYPFYAEVQMSLGANPGSVSLDAELILSPQSTLSTGDPYVNNDALRLILNDGPQYRVHKNVGGVLHIPVYDPGPVQGGSLSISWKIILQDRNTLTVFLDTGSGYRQVFQTASLGLSSSFTPSYIYLALHNQNTASYSASFDYVGLTRSNSITINGLQPGQGFEVYDWNDVLHGVRTALSVDVTTMAFPYGYIKIYELDGRTIEFTSPTREVWGGNVYSYSKPFKSGGLTRASTGFLKANTVYVEDSLPAGATPYSDGGDGWFWSSRGNGPVLSGALSHVNSLAPGAHQHYFAGSTGTLNPLSGYFHVQYIYIPSGSVPSEIMLQFHDTAGSWEHRAYWGSNLIPLGADGSASRRPMGALPAARDSWLMFIVKSNDIGTSNLSIDGLAYTLYDGGVYWDYSALGSSSAGRITVNGLLAGQKVELYDSNGQLKVSQTVAPGSTAATLDVYSAGINTFPFKGYLKVYSSSGSLLSSPALSDMWGGDEYWYNQPTFSNSFSFSTISSSIHNRIIGSAQFQDLGVPQESYYDYTNLGNLALHRQMHNGSPLITTYTYDPYGNPTSMVDARGNTHYYSYSSVYNYAYPVHETTVIPGPGLTFSDNFNDGNFLGWTVAGGWAVEAGELSSGGLGEEWAGTGDVTWRTTLIEARVRVLSGWDYSIDFLWDDRLDHFRMQTWDGYQTLYLYKFHGGSYFPLALAFLSGIDWFQWHTWKITITGSFIQLYLDGVQKIAYSDPTSYSTGKIRLRTVGSHVHFDDVRTEMADTVSGLSAYNFNTGNILSQRDAMGNVTSYQYDPVGRTTLVTFPPVNGLTSNVLTEYRDSQNAVATRNEKGNYTRQVYDGLGRTIKVERYSGDLSSAILSVERYTYNWQGKVKTYMAPDGNVTQYDYDYLGRLVKITSPDNTYRTISYDDLNLIDNRTDENQHRTDYLYDKLQRLIEVREYYSTSSYYSTSYSYDEVGNLVRKEASNQQVLAFTPTDDTYVRSDQANANFGTAATLQVDNSPVKHILIKFTITGIGTAQVTSAKLRLYNVDGSSVGGSFYKTATSTWAENSTTWNNAPATQGSVIASLGSVSANTWYTVDLTSAVTGDGVLSIKVTSSNSDGADYTSRQGTLGLRPHLLLTTSARQTTTYSYDDLNRLLLTKHPDGFNETRTYDNIGNLVIKKDPNGSTTTYDYDGLNRLTAITYPGGSTASFSYDKNSNMVRASNSNSSATFSYDPRNRLTAETWTISGTAYTLSYGYDAVGNMVSLTYPDSKSVSYAVDPLDRVTSVKTGSTTLATMSYASNGAVQTISYGNGVQTSYTYDRQARPSRIKIARGSTTLLDLNYGYDSAGNILTITGSNSETYSYDYLNRLTYSSGPWGTLRYGYDSVGNRLWFKPGTTNTTHTYGPHNRLVGVGSTTAYSFDNNGSLKIKTSSATATNYYYDFENQLTKATQGSSTLGTYAYSAVGQRIKSAESGTTTIYVNMGVNTVYEKKTTGSSITISDHVYIGTNILAKLTGTSIYYFHQDHLGSTRLVTLGTSTSFSTNYQPFGPQYGASGTDPGYKYTGRSSSSAIGLNYHGARWYDPSVGRFTSSDPISGQQSDPQSLNRHTYVSNRPTVLTDPTGQLAYTTVIDRRPEICRSGPDLSKDYWGAWWHNFSHLECWNTSAPVGFIGAIPAATTVAPRIIGAISTSELVGGTIAITGLGLLGWQYLLGGSGANSGAGGLRVDSRVVTGGLGTEGATVLPMLLESSAAVNPAGFGIDLVRKGLRAGWQPTPLTSVKGLKGIAGHICVATATSLYVGWAFYGAPQYAIQRGLQYNIRSQLDDAVAAGDVWLMAVLGCAMLHHKLN